jgi:ankyrin repeat protein
MDDLQSSLNIADVRESLHRVPNNLREMFQKTTSKILDQSEQNSKRAALALRTLSWIAYGVRPLHMRELRHALAIRNADTDLDAENLISSRTIISACRGFVKTDDQGYCRFMHPTAYDFFRAHPRFLAEKVNLDITSTCLNYLSFKAFADSSCGDQASLERRLEQYPFILYVGHFLGHHAQPVERKLEKELVSFLTHPVLRSSFSQMRYYRNRKDDSLRAHIHARLPTGSSAIQVACGLGLLNTAKALLKVGEDISAADDQGWTPLHSAASYGRCDVLQWLIDNRADIDSADKEGWTPLFWATIKGQFEAARILLNSQASTRAEDKSGWTPVHWAAYKGDEGMIRLLKPDFSNIAIRSAKFYRRIGQRDAIASKGLRPLFIAVEQKSTEAFDALLGGQDFHSTPRASQDEGEIDKDKVRARAGAMLTVLSKDEAINYERRINPDANSIIFTNAFLVQLLDSAIKNNHLEMVKLLLERDVDLSTNAYGDLKGRSVLHTAAFCTDSRIAALLVQHGADPSVEDVDGHYPLDLAALNGTDAVIREYLQMKGIGKVIEGRGSSALHLIWSNNAILRRIPAAEDHKYEDSSTSDLETMPSTDLGNIRLELAREMVAAGANVNKRDRDGNTPLHFAITAGTNEVALLCSLGAKLNTPNHGGNTPLHTAIWSEESRWRHTRKRTVTVPPSAEQLLSLGADPNIRNLNGETALHLAAQHRGLTEVRILIEAGADPNIRDSLGRNTLHCLASNYSMDYPKNRPEATDMLTYLSEASAPAAAVQRCHTRPWREAPPSKEVYFPFEMALRIGNEVLARALFALAWGIDPGAVEARLQECSVDPANSLEACMKWMAELDGGNRNAEKPSANVVAA